jgi:hypothetical protein
MIKAQRICLYGILYDNVSIYTYGEPGGKYIPGLFEKYQLFLKTKNISSTINMNMISLIQLKKERPRPYMQQVKRLVVTYEQTSFGPAWMIPEDRYGDLNIPFLFNYDYKNVEHCAFIADGWLYLTKDELVTSIEH